jgi:cation-transporting P-type ATPase 13A2
MSGSTSGRAQIMARSRSNRPILDYIPISDTVYEQTIIVDDDLTLTLSGRERSDWRQILYVIGCICTFGVYYLLCRWYIQLYIITTTVQSSLLNADLILVKNQWDEISLHEVQSIPFHQKVSIAFPKVLLHDLPDQIIEELVYFECRYFRFMMNPLTGQFEPNYAWIDPIWKSLASVLDQDGVRISC